jgi:hypothetical protein
LFLSLSFSLPPSLSLSLVSHFILRIWVLFYLVILDWSDLIVYMWIHRRSLFSVIRQELSLKIKWNFDKHPSEG